MEGADQASEKRIAEALAARVHRGSGHVTFGEMTLDDVRAQADELREVGDWGPLARVAKVARAWGAIASLMEQRGATRVAELDAADVVTWAERTWVIPPAGGMI